MKMTQIRFFGDNKLYAHSNNLDSNYPIHLTAEDLITGHAFLKYQSVSSLTITTLPGTYFTLNGSVAPSVVGASGVFKIDNLNEQFTLTFDKETLQNINTNPDGFLIIDIIYREE